MVVLVKDKSTVTPQLSAEAAQFLCQSLRDRHYKRRDPPDSPVDESVSPLKRIRYTHTNELDVMSFFMGDRVAKGQVRIEKDRQNDSIWLILKDVTYQDRKGNFTVRNISQPLDRCWARNYVLSDGTVCWIILLLVGNRSDAPADKIDKSRKFSYAAIMCRPHPYLHTEGHRGQFSKSAETVRSIFRWIRYGAIMRFWEEQTSLNFDASAAASPVSCRPYSPS